MIDFGYPFSPSSVISLDEIDNTLFNQLAKREPDVRKCMSCGSCAASCTVSNYSEMNLRRVILWLSRGRTQEALKQIPNCMLCGKCLLVCPRGINTRHLILSICEIYNNEKR